MGSIDWIFLEPGVPSNTSLDQKSCTADGQAYELAASGGSGLRQMSEWTLVLFKKIA